MQTPILNFNQSRYTTVPLRADADDLVEFAERWAKNIRDQGWLEAATRHVYAHAREGARVWAEANPLEASFTSLE
jgi:hypothetical protein